MRPSTQTPLASIRCRFAVQHTVQRSVQQIHSKLCNADVTQIKSLQQLVSMSRCFTARCTTSCPTNPQQIEAVEFGPLLL